MALRYALAAVTFGCLGLFVGSFLLGAVGARDWLWVLGGATGGMLVVAATRRLELERRTGSRAARVAFLLASAVLVWGLLDLVVGRDPVTGSDVSPLTATAVLLLSAAPACAGFLLLSMRESAAGGSDP
jgi:hypothetical protein